MCITPPPKALSGKCVCSAQRIGDDELEACIHDRLCTDCGSSFFITEVTDWLPPCGSTQVPWSIRWAGGVLEENAAAFDRGWRSRARPCVLATRYPRARGLQERRCSVLSGKQRRYLRSLGHHLQPVVQIGKDGLTGGVVAAVDDALARHELVKIRVGSECPDDRDDLSDRLAPAVKSEVAQALGRTLLLYRRRPTKPTIVLPRAAEKVTLPSE